MTVKFPHISEFKVRDYECDIQGIVNNANYFHYLEQSRHEFLQANNIDFKQAHDEGLDLVVAKAELSFIKPLRPSDEFYVSLEFQKEGQLRYIFNQNIYRFQHIDQESTTTKSFKNTELMLTARITCACIDRKRSRPCKFELLDKLKEIND